MEERQAPSDQKGVFAQLREAFTSWPVLGLTVTAAYLGWGAEQVVDRFLLVQEMPLNEIGDALAGFFAPLAFLWLVLGYHQQGREMRQNTRALNLQEEALQRQVGEMQQSVRAQKLIYAVAEEQVDLARQTAEMQMATMIKRCQPIFQVIAGRLSNHSQDPRRFSVRLENLGRRATMAYIECSEDENSAEHTGGMPQSILDAESHVAAMLRLKEGQTSGEFSIHYVDELGENRFQKFNVTLLEDGHRYLPVKIDDSYSGVTYLRRRVPRRRR